MNKRKCAFKYSSDLEFLLEAKNCFFKWNLTQKPCRCTLYTKWGFPVAQWLKNGEKKESSCQAGDTGSIPRLGRFPGEGNGNPLQYSCLENPMDRGALVGYSPCGCRVRHDWATNAFTFILFSTVATPRWMCWTYKQSVRGPFSPHSHQHLVFVVVLMTAIFTGER